MCLYCRLEVRKEFGRSWAATVLPKLQPAASRAIGPPGERRDQFVGRGLPETVVRPDDDAGARIVVADEFPDAAVISACGVCREMLRDYDPDVDVIVDGEPHGFDEPVKRPVTELLPEMRWRGGTPPA